jgi:hypothetical protein
MPKTYYHICDYYYHIPNKHSDIIVDKDLLLKSIANLSQERVPYRREMGWCVTEKDVLIEILMNEGAVCNGPGEMLCECVDCPIGNGVLGGCTTATTSPKSKEAVIKETYTKAVKTFKERFGQSELYELLTITGAWRNWQPH